MLHERIAADGNERVGRALRDASYEPCAQKKPGLKTPEQQRQEENGDAAASPATYRKERLRISRRVRKIFSASAGNGFRGNCAAFRLYRAVGPVRQTGLPGREAAAARLPPAPLAMRAYCVACWAVARR